MNNNLVSIAECFSLENQKFLDTVETDRLVIKKEETMDNTITLYSLNVKNNQKIGDIAFLFDGEVMYKINEEYRNNGYVTEALTKLIEMNEKQYYLTIDNNNLPSRKVAKKLGFKKVKKLRNSAIYSNIS